MELAGWQAGAGSGFGSGFGSGAGTGVVHFPLVLSCFWLSPSYSSLLLPPDPFSSLPPLLARSEDRTAGQSPLSTLSGQSPLPPPAPYPLRYPLPPFHSLIHYLARPHRLFGSFVCCGYPHILIRIHIHLYIRIFISDWRYVGFVIGTNSSGHQTLGNRLKVIAIGRSAFKRKEKKAEKPSFVSAVQKRIETELL